MSRWIRDDMDADYPYVLVSDSVADAIEGAMARAVKAERERLEWLGLLPSSDPPIVTLAIQFTL